jgi:hypothetical protein
MVTPEDFASRPDGVLENSAARAIHWINLVSGTFVDSYPHRFGRNGRADQMLLDNLRYIREQLRQAELDDDDICHDLLARIIFVQFLFDRKDSDGVAAMNQAVLARLHDEGVLKRTHKSFAEVLSDYRDTYLLFDWLNEKFNGDLFPGKGDTAAERARGWAKEKSVVTRTHLKLLADFVSGALDMPAGQSLLWPQYSFDVIPLEFISSIYETFVKDRAQKEGIYYTPPHLVDFILDRVLPWSGTGWDLRVLDPACGSGIFLVKVFQRLVHRWKLAHPKSNIRADILRRLLERNIFGVDQDPHAVRVASFSLYLAMCDEIEPRQYWSQVRFPSMRGQRLICADFFSEGEGFSTLADGGTYSLVVGNAPWGDNLITDAARSWSVSSDHAWIIANKDIGGLFLAKSSHLISTDGRIAMIQSANTLLFNGNSTHQQFRRQLFTSLKVDEIYNLSALRFKIFSKKTNTTKVSVAPACVAIISPGIPSPHHAISYISPKQIKTRVEEFSIVVEPGDRKMLTVDEAASDPSVWTVLMWGGQRDRALIRKLQMVSGLDAFSGPEMFKRQGIVYGDQSRRAVHLRDRRLFDEKKFPQGSLRYLDAQRLPLAGDLHLHSRDSTDFRAFASPQLLIKQAWESASGRFQARLVQNAGASGVLCNKSYISVSARSQGILDSAWVTFNSKIAVYFLQLTSGRIAAYRPEALVNELLAVPLAPLKTALSDEVESVEAIDKLAYESFGLKDAEQVLIDDMLEFSLAEFRGSKRSAEKATAAQTTKAETGDPALISYCSHVIRVLKAGFGQEKVVTANVLKGPDGIAPYRLVAFRLGQAADAEVTITRVQTPGLIRELERLDRVPHGTRRGLYTERVVRIYDLNGGIPTIFVVKPDAPKYWTRSVGLSDGDEIASDLFKWKQQVSVDSGGPMQLSRKADD